MLERAIRSGLVLAGAVVLAAPVMGVTSTAHAAAASTGCKSVGQSPSYSNFNGDDSSDAVVGVPGEDVHGAKNAGRIEVRYTGGAAQGLHAPEPRTGDRFGAAFADVQVNDDSCTDLVVGAPGRDVAGKKNAGAILVYLGSPDGLTYAGEYHQGAGGVPGTLQAGAKFGAALAPAYADQLPRHSVWVGAPHTDVGDAADAGSAAELSVTPAGAKSVAISGTLLTEGSGGVPGSAASGDHFGATISRNGIAIAAPDKAVSGRAGAGAVYARVSEGGDYREYTEDTDGIPGAAEAGDHFGTSLLAGSAPEAGVLVGSPGESIGSVKGAGSVTTFAPRASGPPVETAAGYSQGHGDVAGKPEAGDHFGAALGSVEDRTWAGAPGEDLGGVRDAGAVFALRTSVQDKRMSWNQGTAGVPGHNEKNDHFGAALGNISGTTSTLPLVGVPGENSGAGSVLAGLPDLGSGPVRWHQETGASESGDHFGASLSYLHAFPS